MSGSNQSNWSNWYIISIFGGIATIIAFILPTIACWIGYLNTVDSKLQFFLGVGLTLFTLLYTILVGINQILKSTNTKVDTLTNYVKSEHVHIFEHKEKYSKLSELINNAESDIRLMYLANTPPPTKHKMQSERKLYENSLESFLKNAQKRVNLTRIILYTEHNEAWINSIIEKYSDKINAKNKNDKFSLFLTKIPLLSMSIQIFDEEDVIVISALDAKNSHTKKHFWAYSKDLNSVFQMYYEYAKEKHCTCVINKGTYICSAYNNFIKS